MQAFCGCVGIRTGEHTCLNSSSRIRWPWKRDLPNASHKVSKIQPDQSNKGNEIAPIVSNSTYLSENLSSTDSDFHVVPNPTFAYPESNDQDSIENISWRISIPKETTVPKSHPVTFELSPHTTRLNSDLPNLNKRNRSLELHSDHSYRLHSDAELSRRTFPNIFNERPSNSQCRLYYPQNSTRRVSLIAHHLRPAPTGMENRVRSIFFSKSCDQDSNPSILDINPGAETFFDETTIVTPFAQILAGLRSVQKKIGFLIAGSKSGEEKMHGISRMNKTKIEKESELTGMLSVTQQELEWCLQQLENIQTKRPVSDMASAKFKRLLSKKLGGFSNTDKTRNQISEYISRTFMDEFTDNNEEVDFVTNDLDSKTDFPIVTSSDGGKLKVSVDSSGLLKRTPSSTLEVPTGKVKANSVGTMDPGHAMNTNSSRLTYSGIPTKHDEELKRILEGSIDTWGLNIFEVDDKSSEHALTVVSYVIFSKRKLFPLFKMDPSIFLNYILRLEANYQSRNPYHNHIHAADVLQSVHVLLQAESLGGVFSDLEILSVLFASAIHDVNHPGLTNQFLINTGHRLALLYNDASVLENHHLHVAFKLLAETGCDFFVNLTIKQRQALRRLVIELVLATDMSKHMNLLAELRTMVETKELAGNGFLDLDDYNDRSLILQCMIHCADLSNPTKPFDLYKLWTHRVMEEFFLQGDKEKECGLEVSAMCDRDSVVVDKAQISFIDFVVHPLWETWCDLVHPAGEEILKTLESNRDLIQSTSPFSEFETRKKSAGTEDTHKHSPT